MYHIREHNAVTKTLKKVPTQVKRRFVAWKRIIENDGPQGLRLIKAYHDEALKGEWIGCRSSRLSKKWRLIYQVDKEELLVYLINVSPHKY